MFIKRSLHESVEKYNFDMHGVYKCKWGAMHTEVTELFPSCGRPEIGRVLNTSLTSQAIRRVLISSHNKLISAYTFIVYYVAYAFSQYVIWFCSQFLRFMSQKAFEGLLTLPNARGRDSHETTSLAICITQTTLKSLTGSPVGLVCR